MCEEMFIVVEDCIFLVEVEAINIKAWLYLYPLIFNTKVFRFPIFDVLLISIEYFQIP